MLFLALGDLVVYSWFDFGRLILVFCDRLDFVFDLRC